MNINDNETDRFKIGTGTKNTHNQILNVQKFSHLALHAAIRFSENESKLLLKIPRNSNKNIF